MINYPPQPPQLPPGGGYNPFNPYSGYDPNADYVPWLPGRQGPRFIPIALIAGAILLCSCCSFLAGTIFGIELPGLLIPSAPSSPASPQQEAPPQAEPTPESSMWQVSYQNA